MVTLGTKAIAATHIPPAANPVKTLPKMKNDRDGAIAQHTLPRSRIVDATRRTILGGAVVSTLPKNNRDPAFENDQISDN